MTGIIIRGHINNLKYTDDTILIAEIENRFQKRVNKNVRGSSKRGIELNSNKTEALVIL